MHQIIGSLIVGAIAGERAHKLSWRSLAKGAVKQGIRFGRSVQNTSGRIHTEMAQLVDEARAELAADRLLASHSSEGTELKQDD